MTESVKQNPVSVMPPLLLAARYPWIVEWVLRNVTNDANVDELLDTLGAHYTPEPFEPGDDQPELSNYCYTWMADAQSIFLLDKPDDALVLGNDLERDVTRILVDALISRDPAEVPVPDPEPWEPGEFAALIDKLRQRQAERDAMAAEES